MCLAFPNQTERTELDSHVRRFLRSSTSWVVWYNIYFFACFVAVLSLSLASSVDGSTACLLVHASPEFLFWIWTRRTRSCAMFQCFSTRMLHDFSSLSRLLGVLCISNCAGMMCSVCERTGKRNIVRFQFTRAPMMDSRVFIYFHRLASSPTRVSIFKYFWKRIFSENKFHGSREFWREIRLKVGLSSVLISVTVRVSRMFVFLLSIEWFMLEIKVSSFVKLRLFLTKYMYMYRHCVQNYPTLSLVHVVQRDSGHSSSAKGRYSICMFVSKQNILKSSINQTCTKNEPFFSCLIFFLFSFLFALVYSRV